MDIKHIDSTQFPEYVLYLCSNGSQVYAGLANGAVYSISDSREIVPQGSPLTGLCLVCDKLVFTRAAGELGVVDTHTNSCNSLQLGWPCASSTSRGGVCAIGTELKSQDAGILLYQPGKPKATRQLLDSHADDVTDIQWHPSDNEVLISGSVDGTVNLYNLRQQDDDEVIYQTVNHGSSIHRVGFLTHDRFFALSHMETLSIYQVANPDEQVAEPSPVEFGDLREAWNCEYVCDFVNNFFLVGSNNDSTARLIPFVNQTPQLISAINLVGAHGTEVVRCFCFGQDGFLYTGGEDGQVKTWRLPERQKKDKEIKRTSKHKQKKKDHNPY